MPKYFHVITDEMIDASNKKHEKEFEEFLKKLNGHPLYIGFSEYEKIEWYPYEPKIDVNAG